MSSLTAVDSVFGFPIAARRIAFGVRDVKRNPLTYPNARERNTCPGAISEYP
jgi:hypothetical protein